MAAALPLLPESAPFAPEHIEALNAVMARTSAEQRQWLSGFLAGYHAATAGAPLAATAPAATPRARLPLTILYGTESGNAEGIGADLKKAAAKQGFAAKLVDMAEASPADLADQANLLVVASTWGEGDPPERAAEFYAALMAEDAPRFEGVRFAVLALGDSSYVNFCEVGRRIDARLEALGGERIAPRIDCDLDYEASAAAWSGSALEELAERAGPEAAAAVQGGDIIHIDFAAPPAAVHSPTSLYSKANPFPAEITESINLNGSRSTKQTIHLELSLEGSGLAFAPGDSLGIVPENDPGMVEAVLRAARLDRDRPLQAELTSGFDITALSRQVIEGYAAVNPDPRLSELLAGDAWRAYLEGRQIVDLLEDFPAELTPAQLTGLLRKLPPRLYSVASAHAASPDEAHLLIGVVRYQSQGRARHGVASGFVAERLRVGHRLEVYVKPNKNFRLPDDPDRPIVMIGPGTGVAPFRAFLQHRQATGAAGRNWLFFGDRNYTHDFLYQLEWQEWLRDGVLSRLDVAFSRDQPEKIYVQQRLWEHRADLFAWLEDGAHLYVCGDEKAMAKDVHATLEAIVADRSGRSLPDAAAYLADLKKQRRYQRDVY
jgi:sulfite reductase (NADPH) flavoprotein alpha-component